MRSRSVETLCHFCTWHRQTPVLAADQHLYALAKQIQWQWPDYGEDRFVIIFGGLHLELASLRSIGTLLQDSGWTSAICEANMASSGTAETFLTETYHTNKASTPDDNMPSTQVDEEGVPRLLPRRTRKPTTGP